MTCSCCCFFSVCCMCSIIFDVLPSPFHLKTSFEHMAIQLARTHFHARCNHFNMSPAPFNCRPLLVSPVPNNTLAIVVAVIRRVIFFFILLRNIHALADIQTNIAHPQSIVWHRAICTNKPLSPMSLMRFSCLLSRLFYSLGSSTKFNYRCSS